MKWHDGGTMQPLAAEAFEQALRLASERGLRYFVHQRLGMLLKVMGRGEESLDAHKKAFELAASDAERADALIQKAHTLGMLNRVPESIAAIEKSIKIYPKAVSSYLPLVKSHRELKDLDTKGWKSLLARIKSAIKTNSGRSKIDRPVTSLGPDVYWAAFEALDALKQYKEAWRFLELAHDVALQTRERASEVGDMQDQLEQVKHVFKPGFFPEPSIGVDSKLPVFIIGMMRCVDY
jgi:tetratricopeptide (TPR) repeat protein